MTQSPNPHAQARARANADNDAILNDSAPKVSKSEEKERLNRLTSFRNEVAKMEKVTVRVDEDTRVQINGMVLRIKGKTRVAVPEVFAEVLEQAGRI